MATHSKGRYIAFRSGKNKPTKKEAAQRKMRLITPSYLAVC